MLIRIMYNDGRQDRVRKDQLAGLIASGRIKMFKRFYGWVHVTTDPTREKMIYRDADYEGRERRKDENCDSIFLDEPSDL